MGLKVKENLCFTIICGSVRKGSFTRKSVNLLSKYLETQNIKVEIIDANGVEAGILGSELPSCFIEDMKKKLHASSGIIIATPEYNGCFSAVLMTLIENLGYPSVLSGKIISLLGVASGAIGAVKSIEHLRGVCAHIGALVLPYSISIAEVHKHFTGEVCNKQIIESQIISVAKNLQKYLATQRVI